MIAVSCLYVTAFDESTQHSAAHTTTRRTHNNSPHTQQLAAWIKQCGNRIQIRSIQAVL
jgi:ferritin